MRRTETLVLWNFVGVGGSPAQMLAIVVGSLWRGGSGGSCLGHHDLIECHGSDTVTVEVRTRKCVHGADVEVREDGQAVDPEGREPAVVVHLGAHGDSRGEGGRRRELAVGVVAVQTGLIARVDLPLAGLGGGGAFPHGHDDHGIGALHVGADGDAHARGGGGVGAEEILGHERAELVGLEHGPADETALGTHDLEHAANFVDGHRGLRTLGEGVAQVAVDEEVPVRERTAGARGARSASVRSRGGPDFVELRSLAVAQKAGVEHGHGAQPDAVHGRDEVAVDSHEQELVVDGHLHVVPAGRHVRDRNDDTLAGPHGAVEPPNPQALRARGPEVVDVDTQAGITVTPAGEHADGVGRTRVERAGDAVVAEAGILWRRCIDHVPPGGAAGDGIAIQREITDQNVPVAGSAGQVKILVQEDLLPGRIRVGHRNGGRGHGIELRQIRAASVRVALGVVLGGSHLVAADERGGERKNAEKQGLGVLHGASSP